MEELDLDQKIEDNEKEYLTRVLEDIFNACFAHRVEECTTYKDLKRMIHQNAEQIVEYFDDEFADTKNAQINRLESEVADLEYELQQQKIGDGSLLDEWKGEIIQMYAHKYTPQELEKRLSS